MIKVIVAVTFILLAVVVICLAIKRIQKGKFSEIPQENSEDDNFLKSLKENEKGIIEKLDQKNYFYKLGVCYGERVLSVCEFDSFIEVIKYMLDVNFRHGSDMYHCFFVIQAFKDASYDFENSCFSQTEWSVNFIGFYIEAIAKKILNDSEREEADGSIGGEVR